MNTHPYQVLSYVPEETIFKHIGDTHWREECVCTTQVRAERIAQTLMFAQWADYFIVARLDDDGSSTPVAWFPDRETVERETGQ